MRPGALLALALLALPLSGCFGDEPLPAARTVSASGGKISPGWAYDGVGVEAASASLTGSANDPDNTGSFTVTFQYAGSDWAVAFDDLSGSQAFMDGGVEFELVEHGDSGVADASIPKILAKIAAWGTASVTRDGVPVTGAAGPRWTAHLMVSGDTVRQPDGQIKNAAGGPYNPGSPGDAMVTPGDMQALLKLVHPDGETATRAPEAGSSAVPFAGPEQSATIEVPVAQGAETLTVNVTLSGGTNPVGVGQATVNLRDAGGNVTKTQQMTLTPQGPVAASWTLARSEIAGPYVVEIVGAGAFTAQVDWAVAYDDHPLLVLTWDEVTMETA